MNGSTSRDEPVEPDEISLLPLLCTTVASQFPGQPACIAATALLVAAGRHFGVLLRPQPVSVWSGDQIGQSATGHRARDFGLANGGTIRTNSVATDSPTWFQEVGHMIAVSDVHRVILDPTYGQFGRPGAPSPVVMMQVPSITLAGEEAWTLVDRGWEVHYWPVDTPDYWKIEYDEAERRIVPQYLPAVVQIVRTRLKSGTVSL